MTEKPFAYFYLGLTLKDIPDDAKPCLSGDGGTIQKEFLEWECESDQLRVFSEEGMPGYGCTKCAIKIYDPTIYARYLEATAGVFETRGDLTYAAHLRRQLDLHNVRRV